MICQYGELVWREVELDLLSQIRSPVTLPGR